MNKQEFEKRFESLLKEVKNLCLKKNHDYAGDNPMSNLKEFGWKGIVVRLGDKYYRLKNFAENGKFKVKDEKLRDTFIDTAVYALLGVMLLESEAK